MNKLVEKYRNKQIILASGSPRRKELLAGLDIPFVVETKEVDEVYNTQLKAKGITEYLATLKADTFTDIIDDEIIITADTIVWLDDKALMKPENPKEAAEMLQMLSGKCHEVFTSVCIKSTKKQVVFSDVAKVCFKELTTEEIAYYIEKYRPFDRAGAYGVQDWIGYIGIEKMEGSYYNVMGLPVHKLYNELMVF